MTDKYMCLRLDEECQRILTKAKMLMSEDRDLLEGEKVAWVNGTISDNEGKEEYK